MDGKLSAGWVLSHNEPLILMLQWKDLLMWRKSSTQSPVFFAHHYIAWHVSEEQDQLLDLVVHLERLAQAQSIIHIEFRHADS